MSDDEDYEFDYSDNEQEEQREDDIGVEIENKYHESKQERERSLEGARSGFKAVLALEASHKGKAGLEVWGYKATKQLLKLAFRMNQLDDMLAYYVDLLKRINEGQVTRNKAEKNINGILDLVSTSSTSQTDAQSSSSMDMSTTSSSSSSSSSTALTHFYQTTLEALKGSGNERMAFKTNSKLARLYVDAKDWNSLRPLLQSMHASLGDEPSVSSMTGTQVLPSPSSASSAVSSSLLTSGSGTRGTHLVDVYALYIQMYTELRDLKRVAEYARKAESLLAIAVPQPFILGVIKECIGKTKMREREWERARIEFIDAFKAYEEAGNSSATSRCLKYLLLSSMLSESRFNPFDDQSTKAHQHNVAIEAMIQLNDAYVSNDISAFEKVLRKKNDEIRGDDFIRGFVDDLTLSLRGQVTLARLAPYTRVKVEFVAKELNVSLQEAESLLVSLILDGRLQGLVDQKQHVVLLTGAKPLPTVGSTNASVSLQKATGSGSSGGRYKEVLALSKKLISMAKAAGEGSSVPSVIGSSFGIGGGGGGMNYGGEIDDFD